MLLEQICCFWSGGLAHDDRGANREGDGGGVKACGYMPVSKLSQKDSINVQVLSPHAIWRMQLMLPQRTHVQLSVTG